MELSFVDELKKQVQCSLCSDTLIEPKILQCFHTFCKPCIKRHAELIDQINVFKCPRCKSQTFLPELSSVEDLQPNVLYSRMLKGLALVEGEKVCSVSESHLSASCYCFECDRSMCDECDKNHALFTNDHKVNRLADLKKEDIQCIMTRENPCTSHPQHRLESFCEDCDAMICVICLKDHRNHKTMPLDKFASIKKAVLLQQLQVLEKLRLDDKEKEQQEKIANSIKQQGEKAKKEVKDKTKKLIEMLQENELELLRQIEEKLNTATTNLNIIYYIPAVEEYIQNVVERGLASEMMNFQGTQCSQEFMFNHILPSSIYYVPNQELMRQVNSGMGEIQMCLKTDHTKSTFQVKSKTQALKKEKLIVTPKTSTGELTYDPRDVIDIQIKPEENVKIEKKCLRTNGKVEVEFMAKVAGQLTAEVQVNGNQVSNSPKVMNVKAQNMRTKGKLKMKGVNIGSGNLTGIAVNRDNSKIAVSNFFSHRVHIFTTEGDLLLTYGGREGSAKGQLSYPQGLAFLNDTDLVIAERGNHRISIVNTATGTLAKTFGKQGNGDREFNYPCGLHLGGNSNIIVCDNDNYRVQVFTRDGDYQYQFGLTKQDKFHPTDVITHDGLFYVSDSSNHVIHVFEKKGNVPTKISTIGGPGSADGQLNNPWGLAIDNDNHLLVCDADNNRIQKFTLDGRFVGKTCDVIERPVHLTVLKNDQLLVTGTCSKGPSVWRIN